jgi:VanZ family protein
MPMNLNHKFYRYLYYHFPWQFFMVVIFILSSISQQDMPKFVEKFSDKFLHFVVFGILGVLMVHSFKYSHRNFLQKKAVLSAIIFTSLYGIFDELHQLVVPGRYTSFADWMADTLGALIFILIFNFYGHRKTRRNQTGQNDPKNEPAMPGDHG